VETGCLCVAPVPYTGYDSPALYNAEVLMHALPEIPLLDVVLGLASAALLLLAAYFLGRPRPGTDTDGSAPDSALPSLFLEIGPDHTARSLSLVSSLFVHLVGVAMVPWLQLAFPGPLPFRYPQQQAITLEYHIPLPPLLAPSELASLDESAPVREAKEHPDGNSVNPKLANSEKEGGAAKQAEPKLMLPPEQKATTAKADPQPEPAERRGTQKDANDASGGDKKVALSPKEIVKLVIPPVVETNPALRDIVLQPDFTVPLPDDYKLNIPPVVLWTPRPPKLQDKAVLKPTPGDDTTPAHMRLPELEPQLRPPSNLPTLAELQMRNIVQTVAEPKLPVATGDVLPLKGRLPAPDALQQAPSIRGGDGTNSLMVFSQDPNIRTPNYELIPGLRLGAVEASPGDLPAGVVGGTQSLDENAENIVVTNQPEAGDAAANSRAGSPAAGTDPNGEPRRQISIVRGGSGTALSTIQVVDLTPGPGSGSTGPGGAAEGRSLATGNGEGSGSGERGQPDGSEDGKGRLKPLPRARYGIILVSNAKGALPEAEGVLSGNPIYTVYFKVPESPRQWILQYCAPKAASPSLEISEGVVKVNRRQKLDPPYALRKGPVRLHLEQAHRETPKRVVIYGTFDAEGRFENSRVIKGADPEIDQTILAALQAWEFLPAFAEGEPVMVEALLGVPLR